MQSFGLAIVSLALVVAASASPLLNAHSKTDVDDIPVFANYKPGDKCPAPVFSDGCNSCTCTEDGVTAACTLKFCPEKSQTENLPVVYGYQQGDKCPAQQFYNDCNMCACTADGHSAGCTMMACPPHRETRSVVEEAEKIPVVYGYQYGDKCPAQQFYNDCNMCTCFADGHSAGCTMMACPPHRETRSVVEEAEKIPVVYGYQHGDKCPAQQFYNDCNRCACSADGHSAACTLMACPALQVPHIDNFNEIQKCTPHQRFMNQCNGCVCGADGASAICTLMGCPEYN